MKNELLEAVSGPTYRPGDDRYDDERTGLNLAVDHRPALVVVATGAEDVMASVGLAAAQDRALAVLATGHGPSVPANDAVLINTRLMGGIRVDPTAMTAWVGPGVRWRQVLNETARYGLAPLNGSSPNVGAIGYTLGGGAGLLGRRYGYAADHVRRLEVVTADGRLHHVSADTDGDLFWALRGGGGNFGVVVAMEIDLFPVARLFGGGLYFPGEATADVLHGYAEWTRDAPEEMASSILLIRYPDDEASPEPLRGRFVTHLRIAYSGRTEDGEPWVRPLRELGPRLLDTVGEMSYLDVGSIHHEPIDRPYVAYDSNILLRGLNPAAVDTLVSLAGPDAEAPFIVELRHLSGAYSRPPAVPNAVGGRDAAFSLFSGTDAHPESRARRSLLHRRMQPWSTGGAVLNFLGVEDTAPVATAFTTDDFTRLADLKTTYDPQNLFRVNHNIPPR